MTGRDVAAETLNDLDKCLNESLYSIHDRLIGHPRSPKRQKIDHLAPIAFATMRTRKGKPKPKILKVLLDSGASKSIISSKHTKKLKSIKDEERTWTTACGTFTTNSKCKLEFSLYEFHARKLIEYEVHETTLPMAYDMIIGRDLLHELGVTIDFKDSTVTWDNVSIPMKDKDCTVNNEAIFNISEGEAVDDATTRMKKILDAKYEPADLDKVCAECKDLTAEERDKLKRLLEQYEELFDGKLGKWTGDPYEIELKEGVEPYHAKPFPIPKAYEKTLRMEIDRLVELGVLRKVNRSRWAAPTFIIPKKDKTVRFISDFRELNKRIKRKPFPLPKIQDLMLKLEGFQYATSLDLIQGYYHIELSPFSKELCTIVLP